MATATIVVTEETTTGAARESLRAAALNVTNASQKARAAQQAAERGSAAVQQARDHLAIFANLDREADEFRLNAIRDGESASLPAALRQRQHERGQAKEALEGALRASEALARESVDSLRVLERAQADLADAAAGLVLEEAKTLAVELEAINAKRQLLRILLEQFLATNRSAHISGHSVATALAGEDRQLPADRSPLRLAGDYWHRQTEKLTRDVEAPLEPLPTLRDLFGY